MSRVNEISFWLNINPVSVNVDWMKAYVIKSKNDECHDECRCECTESDESDSCKNDCMWSPSSCDCECSKEAFK